NLVSFHYFCSSSRPDNKVLSTMMFETLNVFSARAFAVSRLPFLRRKIPRAFAIFLRPTQTVPKTSTSIWLDHRGTHHHA
uniref:Uncharacterized protein n=1 Tax=Callorhinchus milii TaxID=7868 RepID=A0A4W3J1P3_CALMI